jgi:tRNA pseudouridine38-40 synthase
MATSGTPHGPSRRIALLVEYDGTDFAGSQAQPDQRTVQDVLEAVVVEFTGEAQRVSFAGRTDTGVHARGQVVTLTTATAHSPVTFRRALNHFLPDDIAVSAASEVAHDFDPRRHARSRIYRYEIDCNGREPLRRHRAWQRDEALDVAAMSEAVEALPRGEQDWVAFAGPVPEHYSTVRELMHIDVSRCTARTLAVTMQASGFLPHQVRRTVGALERVGAGKLGIAEFARLIDGPAGSAGPAAPPQGLTLVSVNYEPGTLAWQSTDGQRGGIE